MLDRIHTGKRNDECYSLLWKAPYGTHQVNGIRDNERGEFYDIYNEEDMIKFVNMLNIKETIRGEQYKDIVNSFERNLKQSEDRVIELFEKLEKAERR